MCKYIAYRWVKEELYGEFDNIVYIALREWKEDGLESIIKKLYFQEQHKDEAIEIEIDQSKTLFLFDGYDELSETSLLHGAIKKYNLQNYIITSRPYGYRKSDFDVNEVFETIGFTDENVTAYIDKFFEEQNHKTNLQNFLKQNINIKHIAYIPLMLEMICSLWREKAKSNQSFSSPMTMTELYSEVIEYIFFEYSETNNTAYIQDKEDEIFNYLGKIAFEGLKRQVIVLDKSIIKEKKEFFVEYVLKIGFLKSDRKHRNPLMNSYEFPHLTFQEYFSALYVSKLPKEEISEVIREYKFYPYMQVFFAFLGGLIDDEEWFLLEIKSEPKDVLGIYSTNFSFICFGEMANFFFTKSIIDIYIFWVNFYLFKRHKYPFMAHIIKNIGLLKENDKLIQAHLDILRDESNTDNSIKSLVIDAIEKISFKNEKVFSSLEVLIESESWHDRYRMDTLLSLINIFGINKRTISLFIDFVTDDYVVEPVRKDTINELKNIKLTTLQAQEICESIIRSRKINSSHIACFPKLLLENPLIVNKELAKVISTKGTWEYYTRIESIPDRDYRIKAGLSKNETIEFLISNVNEDKKLQRNIIDYLLDNYSEFIIEIFNEVQKLKNIYLIKYFLDKINISVTFILFDLNNIKLINVFEKGITEELPLYLKKNKLYSIFKNKEIKTKRDVYIEDIERVKKELDISLPN